MRIFASTMQYYCWDDSNPRIQLEPRGNRGYIELKVVKQK